MHNQNLINTNFFFNLCCQRGHKNINLNNSNNINTSRSSFSIYKNNNYNNKHLDCNTINNNKNDYNINTIKTNNNDNLINCFLKNKFNDKNIIHANCNKINSNYKNNLNNNLCNNLCFCQICSCFISLCFYFNKFKTINNNNTDNEKHNFKNNENTRNIIETSRFYRFLARFSGRRRNLQRTLNRLTSTLVCILIVISLFSVTEACSARTTPKPRPPPTPTPRPNITFHTYKCPATYAEWYCLNDATCFSVKIGDEILYNCWCADGYMGPRCEYKEIDGSFLPTRPRIMMETASIASGATLALIVVLILCFVLYIRYQQNQKQKLAEESNGNAGIDAVDGFSPSALHYQERRPFGPHHSIPIPMSVTLKR